MNLFLKTLCHVLSTRIKIKNVFVKNMYAKQFIDYKYFKTYKTKHS